MKGYQEHVREFDPGEFPASAPCVKLGDCPYGWLVELFPLGGKRTAWDGMSLPGVDPDPDADRCPVFGHDCPAHYVGYGK